MPISRSSGTPPGASRRRDPSAGKRPAIDRVTDSQNIFGIERPTLLLDTARARRNLARMAGKARKAGLRLRPHFKTHQSAAIGEWFREAGVDGITVSSTTMAEFFSRQGWKDITLAFLVNVLELPRIRALSRGVRLGLLVDSSQAVSALAGGLDAPVRLWIKIDTGYGRTGVRWDEAETLRSIVRQIEAYGHLELAGLLTHSGQSYHARSADEILRIHDQAVSRLQEARQAIRATSAADCGLSVGDTPTASLAAEWAGVDEIRPGNFIFHDVMQLLLGVCQADDIAVAVACPVVGKYERRGQIVVYGGAVHLGKEQVRDHQGAWIYGYLTVPAGGSLGRIVRGAPVVSLSQEHGIVTLPADALRKVRIGDVAYILPVHSCLTCDLYPSYQGLDGSRLQRMPH